MHVVWAVCRVDDLCYLNRSFFCMLLPKLHEPFVVLIFVVDKLLLMMLLSYFLLWLHNHSGNRQIWPAFFASFLNDCSSRMIL